MDETDLCDCGYLQEQQATFESEEYQAWLDAAERELLLKGLPAVIYSDLASRTTMAGKLDWIAECGKAALASDWDKLPE